MKKRHLTRKPQFDIDHLYAQLKVISDLISTRLGIVMKRNRANGKGIRLVDHYFDGGQSLEGIIEDEEEGMLLGQWSRVEWFINYLFILKMLPDCMDRKVRSWLKSERDRKGDTTINGIPFDDFISGLDRVTDYIYKGEDTSKSGIM